MNYMDEALKEAYEGISKNHGGPFGTVIVKDGKIVGRGHNQVLSRNDPTCHGEIEAIRNACAALKTHNLSGCELYTTAEPCPMCLGAILWANIRKIFYGCRVSDTAEIGFRDDEFYREFESKGENFSQEFEREKCLELFADYTERKAERY